MDKIIWTIGHSNRSISDFTDILKHYKIEVLADVRSLPGSNKYPWFNSDYLSEFLKKNDIKYIHIKELGGLRANKSKEINNWKNKSFQAYANHVYSDEFMKGINILLENDSKYRVAIMCSEVLWWRCHRSIIADFMKSIGWEVINIFDINKSEIHPYTSVARIVNGKLTYK